MHRKPNLLHESDPLHSAEQFDTANHTMMMMNKIPRVPWTVADLFANPPSLAVFYQSVGTAYDLGTPMGSVLAGVCVHPLFHTSTDMIETVANGGLVGGFAGMAFGAIRYATIAAETIPVRHETIVRDNGIRELDAGTYTGLAVGGFAVATAGGPASVGLSTGVFGVLQSLSLGAATGSLLSLLYMAAVLIVRQQN